MTVVRIGHSFNFDSSNPTCRNFKSPPKSCEGTNEIPKSIWQLSCERTLNGKWSLFVDLQNFIEFRKENFIAIGTVVLKGLDFNYLPQSRSSKVGLFSSVCSDYDYSNFRPRRSPKYDSCQHFDLELRHLKLMRDIRIWSFENVELVREKNFEFSVDIILISKNVATPTSNMAPLLLPTVSKKPPTLSKIQSDFSDLLENGLYADLILVSEEREFKVHKSILCARSNVFRAMLEADMKEKNESKVEIFDVKSCVLEKMLKFIYTGNFECSGGESGLLEGLYTVADMYEITDLKKIVAERLCSGLTIENIGKRLILADQFKEMVLRQKCLEFMRDNCAVLAKHGESLLFP